MKIFKSFIYTLAAMGAVSCSQETMPPMPETTQEAVGDVFSITATVTVPDMPVSLTRGKMGDTPNGNLKLTLLEFAKGTDATNSNLTRIYQAETISTTDVGNGQSVKFKVSLNSTTEPRILHLMVTDDFVSCNYGSEATVLPTVTTGYTNGISQEAYWGRVEFPDGYVASAGDDTQTLRPEVKEKLTDVPVIRNFAKVSIQNNATSSFELYGFQLVNVPTSGTIAPYNAAKREVPNLLSGNAMLGYKDAVAIYEGIVPADAGFRNQESEVKGMNANGTHDKWVPTPQYIYEHPFESARRTYMIVQGRYRNADGSTIRDNVYYKIDLGSSEGSTTGMFDYYDLLRNYNYNVVIHSVSAPGAATPSEAIDGPTYNNLSASVETKNMTNVSDGDNMLFVSDTSLIFVNEQPVTFMYRYIRNIGPDQAPANDVPVVKNLSEGAVVKSISETSTFTDANGVEWKAITITPNTPTADIKEQSFTVVDPNGLGREISMVLHTPWDISNANEYPGHDNERPATGQGTAPSQAQGELTVYFDLPDGLAESMFPLQFRLEANPQNVENNPIGTMVVFTGPSLFAENNGAPAISYIKTVSWKEYNFKYRPGESNDVDTGVRNPDHTVRCRFRTINVGTGQTKMIISNPYFNNQEITFTRQ